MQSNIPVGSGDYDVGILGGLLFPPTHPCAGPQSPLSVRPQSMYPELSIPLPMIYSSVASQTVFRGAFWTSVSTPANPPPLTAPHSWGHCFSVIRKAPCTLLFQRLPPRREGESEPQASWSSFTQSLSSWSMWTAQGTAQSWGGSVVAPKYPPLSPGAGRDPRAEPSWLLSLLVASVAGGRGVS